MKDLKNLFTNYDNYEQFIDLIPSLSKLSTTPQDKFYHAEGDVWTHTKMVLDELHNSPIYQNSSDDKKFIMFYAALLHDISKPDCTKFEDDGRITSAGHSKRGAVDSRILLWKMQVPFHLREAICNVINTHQVPFFAFNDKPKPGQPLRTPQFLAHSLSWQMPLDCLIGVATADMLGRSFVDKQNSLNDIELFTEIINEEGCFNTPFIFPDDETRLEYFRSKGAISPCYPFYHETKSKVYVMCGIPASGKSTWVESKKLPVVSFDDAREELGLKHSNSGEAYQYVVGKAKEYLRSGVDFIWDGTHLSQQMRNKTLDLLFAYHAEITLVYVEANEKLVKERNVKRNTTLTNSKIDSMLFKWEVPTPIETHNIIYIINGEEYGISN